MAVLRGHSRSEETPYLDSLCFVEILIEITGLKVRLIIISLKLGKFRFSYFSLFALLLRHSVDHSLTELFLASL